MGKRVYHGVTRTDMARGAYVGGNMHRSDYAIYSRIHSQYSEQSLAISNLRFRTDLLARVRV